VGLFKSDPPAPPNPLTTASAATSTNVNTAVANAFLNHVNQNTPQGSLYYDPTGNYNWTDPTTSQTYNIPTFTATQVLSPQQQTIQNLGTQSETNLAQLASNQSGQLTNLLSNPMSIAGAPAAGDPSQLSGVPPPVSSYWNGPQQQTTLGPSGAIQMTEGANDFSADRANVEQSLYQRMDPQLQRDRASLESRLADQGINAGSPAYQAAWDQFNRQLTDTRLGITAAAGQEQQRMQQQALAQANFANSAQQQQYQEAIGTGQFANAAQAQNYQQAALSAQFKNQSIAQQQGQIQSQIAAQNQARQQWEQEQYQLRNQPINEITALMSGSQVQQPNFVNTPTNQIPTTDIAGLINTNFNQQLSNYQQQSQNFNSLMGGIFGALAGTIKPSDRRVKENIHRVGTVFAAAVPDVDHDEAKKKLPIYSYSYKDDPASVRHVGPMAQDVEKIDPRAVTTRRGVKHIDTSRVMGSILRAA
jgi:hypothetical protein